MNDNNILEKIKKLHALSEGNSNVEEASAAFQKIQELCFKYNIELEQALKDTQKEKTPYVVEDYFLKANKFNVTWKSCLLYYVALGNFSTVVRPRKTLLCRIIGQNHNLEVIKYTYEYLDREFTRLSQESASKRGFLDGRTENKYINNFCLGAASAIHRRMVETKEEQTTVSDCKELVIVKDKELKSAVAQLIGKTGKPGKTRGTDINGYYEGKKAGESISLNIGVSHNSKERLSHEN